MRARSAASTAGDGVSSISFWWRRWIVQSRSPRWMTLPCASASTCTSTWRGSTISFSTYTSGLAKYDWPCRCAVANARSAASGACTSSMPLPPPPAAALISSGYPSSSPSASSSSSEPTGSVVPGMIGTPAACIAWRARVFEPISSIASGGGPIQTSPAASTARANAAFSARKP